MTDDAIVRDLEGILEASPGDLAQQLLAAVLERTGDPAAGMPALRELATTAASARVRANALALFHRLGQRSGDRGGAFTAFRDLARDRAATDESSLVRAVAATMLLQLAGDAELPALRDELAGAAHALAQHPEITGSAVALRRLEGSAAAARVVAQAMATRGGGEFPPDILELLGELERDPVPAAAPALAEMFTRVPAVAERTEAAAVAVPGAGTLWDHETALAVATLRAYLACVSPQEAAGAVRFLRAADAARMEAIVRVLPQLGERGGRLAAALAEHPGLSIPLRALALGALAELAAAGGPTGETAASVLRAFRDDPSLGEVARRLGDIG